MRIERDQTRVVIVVAVLLAGFGLGSYLPERAARAKLEERRAAAQREIGVDTSSTSLSDLHERVASLRLTSQQTQGYVPQTDELAQVLRGLTESLDAFGAAVQEVVVGDIRHYRDYSIIPLSLQFESGFPAAYGVLKQIETMPRVIRAERVRIKTNAGGVVGRVQVELNLSTFYSPRVGPQGGGQ